ncbi:fungal chitosanase of glycosyl hydrolase group 75-domain-containing protein [Auriculariales sp. MPI-PUGE-AT-0066]|nr:fungal chitosanase of glycosyl hydrolase group 75-domain-containing protein [Auriculariales sp. MPI-PUGE-AT-0066]
MSSPLARYIYLALFVSGALAHYTNVTRRDASEFAADSSIDVKALYDFVKAGSGKVVGSYPTCNDCDGSSNVDLHLASELPNVITFIADMDIDCDGVNWKCPGNPDGQAQTNWGAMDTYQAPWFVLPDEWYESQGIVPNNLGAVICGDKMFYAVFADSNGDTPQVIGEASLVLGNACYPDAGLSGAVGHSDVDVAYIVFSGETPSGVGEEKLEYGPLKELGDQKVKELLAAIGGGSTTPSDPETNPTETEPAEPTETEPTEPTETEPTEPTETEPTDPETEPTDPPTEPEPTCGSKKRAAKRTNLRSRHAAHKRRFAH